MRNHTIIAFLFALLIHSGIFLLIFFAFQSNEKTQIITTSGTKTHVSISNFSIEKNIKLPSHENKSPTAVSKPANSSSPTQSDSQKSLDQNTSWQDSPTSQATSSNGLSFSQFTPPIYPRFAREKGLEGVVAVSAKYNNAGQITEIKILKSSGIKAFDQSVLEASKTWKIKTEQAGNFEKNFEFKLNN